MARERNDQVHGSDSAEEARGKHVATRRKLLKAGLASAPVIVTMRSGTAWAVSACVDAIPIPSKETANTALNDGREIIKTLIGATDSDIDSEIEGGSIVWTSGPESTKDFYYLAATAPSCYQSFCAPGGAGGGCGTFE